MLDLFFIRDGVPTALLLQGSYRFDLLALSVLVAVLSSIMALQVAGMARLANGAVLRQTAFLTGSFSLGVGIWSMHFIGMLAFNLCTTVSYDYRLTLLSMLPAIFASWVTLNLLWQRQITGLQLLLGGVLVGSGIGTMHYSGMAAMVMAPQLRYDPLWFAASIVVAVVLAMLALWIRFGLRRRGTFSAVQSIVLGGVVMGLAIAGMHYTGMAAARFIGYPDPPGTPLQGDNTYLALAIALFTLTAGVFVLAGNAMLRYRQLFAQMQQNEAELRAVVDTAVDGIITIDSRGHILALNQAAEQMFGWAASELIGHNINQLMPDPYRSGHDGYLAHYLATGDARVIGVGREVMAQRRDGSVFPIRLAVGRAQSGKQVRFIGFVTDISERTRLARELQARETQYRTLIANMPGVAFRSKVDADWSKLFISHAITALTGWERELFLNGSLSMVSIMHPDDLARVRDTVDSALREHRSYVVEYRIFHRDGGERWVSESAGGVYDMDDSAQWIDGVIVDITDSKARTAEHEGVVAAIRQAMAVLEFDLHGHILDANDNFLQLVGYRLDALRGQHHRRLCRPDEADSQAYRDFWAALQRGEFHSGEFCRLRADGSEVWIQATYNPILDADGKPWKIVKLANDLTPRKRMERELVEARDRAEHAAQAKGMFLANMSHEIRTPMNAIIGFTELLQGTALDPQQARHLRTVHDAAHSLLRLLNDILDTAKLERGALALEQHDFSLYTLCEQLVGTFALQAASKGLQLQLDYAADCPHAFHGDALRVRQILTNLLGNAVKFAERGSVTLSVRQHGGQLQLTVRDTGIGIAADRLDSIFAPFTQADASMARRFGGTGLGTAIARQLVELMQGRIEVTSRPGEGSCFTVTLPLPAAQAVLPALAAGVDEVASLPPLRILAVDDVAENLELLQLVLARHGHQVVTAAGGADAVAAYCGQPFDLVLMDVQMAGVDGLEATRRIRQWEATRQLATVPVIALTASVLSQDREDAEAAGMNGFATKPVDPPALLAEMARVLGLAQAAVAGEDAAAQDIDLDAAIALWGSQHKVQARWRRLLADYHDVAAQLAAQPAEARAALAHRLRGAAANLGLRRVAAAAAALEHGDGDIARLADGLTAALQAVAAALPGALDTDVAPATDTPAALLHAQEAAALLDKLQQACEHGELDDASLAALQAVWPHPLLPALQQALDEFDFDAALQALAQLRQAAAQTR